MSKSFDYVRPQSDGSVRVRERHVSAAGVTVTRSYVAESVQRAEDALATRDVTRHFRREEEARFRNWVLSGSDPSLFVFTETTVAGVRRLKMEMRADIARDIAEYQSRIDARRSDRTTRGLA